MKALQAARYHIEPDVYSENTMVVEFPVKAASADYPGFKSAGEVSVAEQLANQAFLQKYWADNSVSCTITFQEDEKPLLAKMLRQYAPQIKSTSMCLTQDTALRKHQRNQFQLKIMLNVQYQYSAMCKQSMKRYTAKIS